MAFVWVYLVAISLLLDFASAAPATASEPLSPAGKRALSPRGVTTLPAATLAGWAPYTQFARAAYCGSSTLAGWDCGEACSATSSFVLSATGGDGNDVQYWFTGYYPPAKSVIVAHEGTDPTEFLSVCTDADAFLEPLDTSIFPGVPSTASAHNGFLAAHAVKGRADGSH